jgi:hypothetical protein
VCVEYEIEELLVRMTTGVSLVLVVFSVVDEGVGGGGEEVVDGVVTGGAELVTGIELDSLDGGGSGEVDVVVLEDEGGGGGEVDVVVLEDEGGGGVVVVVVVVEEVVGDAGEAFTIRNA